MTERKLNRRALLKSSFIVGAASSLAGCTSNRDQRAVEVAKAWLDEQSGDVMAGKIISALQSTAPTLGPLVSLVEEDIHQFIETRIESLSWKHVGGPVYEGDPYRAVWFEAGRETETIVIEERNLSEAEKEARYAGNPPENTDKTMTVPGGKGEFYSKLYFSVYIPSALWFWENATVNQVFLEELRVLDTDILSELGIGQVEIVDKGLHRPSGVFG